MTDPRHRSRPRRLPSRLGSRGRTAGTSTRRWWLVPVMVSVLLFAVVGTAGAAWQAFERSDEPAKPEETFATRAQPSVTTAPPTTPSPEPTPTVDPVEPLVLAISVDGFNPEAISRLGARGAPSFHRLVNEGAATFNARTAYERTITLPNHTGMLTGRPIAGSGGHNVTFNDDNGKTLRDTHGSYVPGMFDVAHDHGRQTAFFAQKDKFTYLIRSWDGAHGAPDTVGDDDGRDKTDLQDVAKPSDIVAQTRKALADGRTDLIFLHLSDTDAAGHDDGWLDSDYLDAVRSIDRHLGSIFATIDADPDVKERVTIVLTADHGGPEGRQSHSDAENRANYRIPFVAWGRGVTKGSDLYELNGKRADPGNGRPGYSGAQPIRNIDVANTALSLLDLPSVEGALSSQWPAVQVGRD